MSSCRWVYCTLQWVHVGESDWQMTRCNHTFGCIQEIKVMNTGNTSYENSQHCIHTFKIYPKKEKICRSETRWRLTVGDHLWSHQSEASAIYSWDKCSLSCCVSLTHQAGYVLVNMVQATVGIHTTDTPSLSCDTPSLSYDTPSLSYDTPSLSYDTPSLSYDTPSLSYDTSSMSCWLDPWLRLRSGSGV